MYNELRQTLGKDKSMLAFEVIFPLRFLLSLRLQMLSCLIRVDPTHGPVVAGGIACRTGRAHPQPFRRQLYSSPETVGLCRLQ